MRGREALDKLEVQRMEIKSGIGGYMLVIEEGMTEY